MTASLKKHILRFVSPSKKEMEDFLNIIELENIPAKHYILKEGHYCNYNHFIVKGCFRSFFINKKGVEKTINFGIEDWWLTDFDSFMNQTQTQLNIQATEDATVLKISKTKLDTILQDSLEINKYFRIILERVRIADQRRIQYMFNLSGKELYNTFYEYNPEFVQRIPQYMLASYLGFTPEFLSKIRAKKHS
ncbi:Crp/Fnr family transcriptional regulator [uncultured Aquimarina sp.]|uniref:Crp/Fnr family transcriptional regulator n=1 Tax=uncultured Aquimarina sp. TaxID=575652 RepID=UPI00262C0666|nr:Crp/Fnr family transcriptional regulator [uncultured Aquimarina sp.]